MTKTKTDQGPHKDPLDAAELQGLHAFWRACNYLALGMI